ncbi:MAG: DUF58 domain-containing protein [Clostridiaceae bacterium]|nr:DUF58 domain-containing protein [Clostridiaceae bacterium]
MAYLIIILLLLLLIAAQTYIFRKWGLRGVTYEIELSESEVYEGEVLRLTETMSNRKRLFVPWIKVELGATDTLSFGERESVLAPPRRYVPSFYFLRGWQQIVRRWTVHADFFGLQYIDRALIVSADLLGMTTLTHSLPIWRLLLILPRLPNWSNLPLAERSLWGEMAVRRNFLPDPFMCEGVRKWEPGDSLRHIHWPATAREGKLMAHKLRDSADPGLLILLNLQSRPGSDALATDYVILRRAVHIAAGCVDQCLGQGVLFQLYCNGHIPPERVELAEHTLAQGAAAAGGQRSRARQFDLSDPDAAKTAEAENESILSIRENEPDAESTATAFSAHIEFNVTGTGICTALRSGHNHALNILHILALIDTDKALNFSETLANLPVRNLNADILIITPYVDDFIRNFCFAADVQGRSVKVAMISPIYGGEATPEQRNRAHLDLQLPPRNRNRRRLATFPKRRENP